MHISKDMKREAHLMRRDLKKQYKREKARLFEKRNGELYRFYELCGMPLPCDPPKRSVLEEVGNSVSHGLGALLSFAALIIMLTHAKTVPQRVGAVVYFFGLFAVFASSCLYHAFKHGTGAKRLFRRFDYASVYILIGATFCPILLNFASPGTNVTALLLVQWTIIIFGATSAIVFGPARFVYPHISLYLILGWSALLILPSIGRADSGLFYSILGGGLLYTLGVIPCAIDKHAAHFVWHIFVLIGAVIQCIGVLNFIYLM